MAFVGSAFPLNCSLRLSSGDSDASTRGIDELLLLRKLNLDPARLLPIFAVNGAALE